jgi:hypothetical protein
MQINRFNGHLNVLLHAIFNNREGELLQLDGCWKPIRVSRGDEEKAYARACWHVQYATRESQRACMDAKRLPGSWNAEKRGTLHKEDIVSIGSTSVAKVDKKGISHMREAKVFTWPQLFLLGLQNDFTAMEVFVAGFMLERIVMERQHPPRSQTSAAQYALRQSGN